MADTPDNDDEFNAALIAAVNQMRSYQGARSTKREYRDLEELDDAKRVLEAAGIAYSDLRHNDPRYDPPDCEAIVDGQLCGIEVTEFAHQHKLGKSIKAIKSGSGKVEHHDWTRDEFLQQLKATIRAKDNPTELKGGPYNYRYFLIIWTGEMYLGKEALEAFLEGEVFVCSLITDAYIGLDYHPGSDCPYPAIPLNIIRAGVGSGG
jgi:hypothetical protein